MLKKFDTNFDTKYNGGGGGGDFGTFVYVGASKSWLQSTRIIWLNIKIKSLSQQEIQLPRE